MFSVRQSMDQRSIKWVIIIGVLGFLFKLWIVGGHDILVKFRPHDDSLFAILAVHILEGNWLGDYNNKTLIKGVGYPLFMALSAWLGVSILTLQQFLYAFVCLFVALAMKPVARSPIILLAGFLFLLFNPMTYTYPLMSVTMRASLYISLSLWVLASLIGLWNVRARYQTATFWWTVSLSIAFSWLWITREESIWILPAAVSFCLIYLLPFRWNAGSNLAVKLVTVLIPIGAIYAVQTIIISKNQSHYGVAIANELKSEQFASALGGLMRIKHESLEKQVIVSNDAQAKAFEASPSFAELEPYLQQKKRMPASFYIWQFRSAARKAGYYENPHDATRTLEFYWRIGQEVNEACNSGKLDCYDRSPSIRPIWHAEFNSQILPVFWDLTVTVMTSALFRSDTVDIGSKEDIDTLFFNDVLTGENTLRKSIYFEEKLPAYYHRIVLLKQAFMGLIGVIYKYLLPILFVVAILVHFSQSTMMLLKRQISPKPIFGWIILGSIFTVLCMLTYVKITIWPVDRPLHTLSPILLLYVVYILTPSEP